MQRLILYSFRATSLSIQRILNGTSYSSFSFVNAELTETDYSKQRKGNRNNRKGKENEAKEDNYAQYIKRGK